MFSVKFEGKLKYLVLSNLWVYGNCTVTQRIKKSWFISREDLNLVTINTRENAGLCHYFISVRNTSVVAINMMILAIDGSW